MDEVKVISQPKKSLESSCVYDFRCSFFNWGFVFSRILAGRITAMGYLWLPWMRTRRSQLSIRSSRWFGAQHGATVGILFTGSLLTLLWKPWNKPLLLQFYSLGFIIFPLVYALFSFGEIPFTAYLIFLIPITILAVFYPGKDLWSNMFKAADFHRPLLLLTTIALVALFPITWDHAVLQLKDSDVFSQHGRWAGSVNLSVALVFASLLALPIKPAGNR